MNPINALLAALVAANTVFVFYWGKTILAARSLRGTPSPATDTRFPTLPQLTVGFVTNFFDTLGIGSYAPTTAFFKLTKMVNDRIIPGTLMVGHNLNTIVQTFLFIAVVQVDVTTLFSMIGASVLGSWLGAGVVAKWPKRKIQVGMGTALLVAATLIFLGQINVLPGGGEEIGVTGVKLLIAVAVNFVLGALMTLGIGLYAPCMVTIYLLGMNPRAAFPIMMGSCAFLMPIGAIRFIKEGSYSNRPAMGLLLGGVPAVLTAFYIVQTLPLYWVRWLVIAVVLYTAVSMLRSALSPTPESSSEPVEVQA